MKKYFLIIFVLLLPVILFWPKEARAMPLGSLVYRTSSDGKMYGYSGLDLIKVEHGLLTHLYTGHVGIYVGQENGVDYIVEALANGIVKTPAKNFVNLEKGEVLLGAKLPISASPLERATAIVLAKNIAATAPAYDFDFHAQKGPESGQWICSGFVEKIYESANTGNPYDLRTLQYDPEKYAVNITPDGFDNYTVVNDQGDVLSQSREFSKINRRNQMKIPAPEIIGYDAGVEKDGERYMFIPFTQFAQPSLVSVKTDIPLASSFDDQEIRGKQPTLKLIVKWSLINNPLSSLRLLTKKISNLIFPQAAIAESETNNTASSSENIMPQTTQKQENWSDLFPNPNYQIIENPASANKNASSTDKYGDNPEVARVIDGDTFVLKDGRKVRYLDVDAPEIISSKRKTNECRGQEAKIFNEQLLSSGELVLVPDPLAKKDSYSRWLFYVYILKPDGKLIFANSELVASGLADPYLCPEENKPSCPRPADLLRWEIIKKAGEEAKEKKAQFLAICKAEKEKEKEKEKDPPEIPPIIISTSTPTTTPTTTPPIKTPTSTPTTTPIKTPTTTPIKKPTSTPISSGGGSSTPSLPVLPSPLITKIFSNGDNHWLEIFNPNDQNYDLAAYNYRLEKAKTALDPGIMLRFSESKDFYFNSGKVIPPFGKFLLVGSKSEENWLAKADAVILNEDFNWGKSGYTIYSGLKAISSPDDPDIVDKIGFGDDATYFQGQAAPALNADSFLERTKDVNGNFLNSGNNFLDFKLVSLNPIIASTTPTSTEPIVDPTPTSTPTSTEPIVDPTPTSTPTSTPTTTPIFTSTSTFIKIQNSEPEKTFPPAIDSPGLDNVWHFDECEGNYAFDSLNNNNKIILPNDYLFDFGKNGCAIKLNNSNVKADFSFENTLTLNEVSAVFYYRADPGAELFFIFNQNGASPKKFSFKESGFLFTDHLSSIDSSFSLIIDGQWHRAAIKFSLSENVIILYQDGEEVNRFEYFEPFVINEFSFSGSNILIDELAIWHRSVDDEELSIFFQSGDPFYTADLYHPLLNPQKIYHWHLGEADNKFYWNKQPKRQILPEDFSPRDISYEFWWRNISYPEDGRVKAGLLNNEEWLVTSEVSLWYSTWTFGPTPFFDSLLGTNDPFIPQDDLWHHFVLAYDSRDLRVNWYIDGEQVISKPAIWLRKPVKEIIIKADNYPFQLSDFGLWEGTISQEKARELFQAGKPQISL